VELRKKPSAPPWVLGHRGARRVAPENTLLSFDRALCEGAVGVELDVRLSSDQKVVICHDVTLGRLTNQKDIRAVGSLTARELSQVELGDGQGIPTLADVLGFAEGRMKLLNIELKSDRVSLPHLVRAVGEVCESWAGSPTCPSLVFSSFSLGALLLGRAHRLPGALAWLLHPRSRWSSGAPLSGLLGCDGLHPHVERLEKPHIERWHARGAYVATWTANQPSELQRIVELGVDGVITDVPSEVMSWL
jgi:glycerophosphoryl diester phosphodiesterase